MRVILSIKYVIIQTSIINITLSITLPQEMKIHGNKKKNAIYVCSLGRTEHTWENIAGTGSNGEVYTHALHYK